MVRPNILWLVLDTARADVFEPYGAPAGASPTRPPHRGAGGWEPGVGRAAEAIRAGTDDGGGDAERFLDGWLDRRPPGPFFAFVNLMECHSPYLPPRPYNDLPPWQRIKAAQ